MNRLNLLSILFLLLSASCTETDEFDTLFSVELTEQSTKEREYVEINNREHVFQSSRFSNPQRLLLTENSFIVFDYGNEFNAQRFSWNFKQLNEIDLRSGHGPGEVGQLADIEVISDTLYLADAYNALIHTFDVQGNFIRSLSIDDKIPLRISSSGENGLFIATPLSHENGLEAIYSFDGKKTYDVASISANDIKYRILLDSEYASDLDHLFRAPQFFGALIAYDETGSIALAKKTIDGFVNPFDDQMPDSPDQPLMVNRNEIGMATLRVKATNDLVCTLIIKQVGDPGMERVTDCYDSKDLEYQFSIETPDGTQDFGLSDAYFITVQDTTVTVSEFQRE